MYLNHRDPMSSFINEVIGSITMPYYCNKQLQGFITYRIDNSPKKSLKIAIHVLT